MSIADNRSFTINESSINISGGRYTASTPILAGKKIAKKLFADIEGNKQNRIKKIYFCVKETTKTSKKKLYNYIATKSITGDKKYKIEVKAGSYGKKTNSFKKVKGGIKEDILQQMICTPKPYILITDIGRDIDDTMALLVLLHQHIQKKIKLLGIVVSGMELTKRKHIAYYWLHKFKIYDIPVVLSQKSFDHLHVQHIDNRVCILPDNENEMKEAIDFVIQEQNKNNVINIKKITNIITEYNKSIDSIKKKIIYNESSSDNTLEKAIGQYNYDILISNHAFESDKSLINNGYLMKADTYNNPIWNIDKIDIICISSLSPLLEVLESKLMNKINTIYIQGAIAMKAKKINEKDPDIYNGKNEIIDIYKVNNNIVPTDYNLTFINGERYKYDEVENDSIKIIENIKKLQKPIVFVGKFAAYLFKFTKNDFQLLKNDIISTNAYQGTLKFLIKSPFVFFNLVFIEDAPSKYYQINDNNKNRILKEKFKKVFLHDKYSVTGVFQDAYEYDLIEINNVLQKYKMSFNTINANIMYNQIYFNQNINMSFEDKNNILKNIFVKLDTETANSVNLKLTEGKISLYDLVDDVLTNSDKISNGYDLVLTYLALYPDKFNSKENDFFPYYDQHSDIKNANFIQYNTNKKNTIFKDGFDVEQAKSEMMNLMKDSINAMK
jgi:hypothetical protein